MQQLHDQARRGGVQDDTQGAPQVTALAEALLGATHPASSSKRQRSVDPPAQTRARAYSSVSYYNRLIAIIFEE